MSSGNRFNVYALPRLPVGDRRRLATAPTPYQIDDFNEFDLGTFSRFANLRAAAECVRLEGGPAAGSDGVRPREIAKPHMNSLIRQVSRQLSAGKYKLGPVRTAQMPKPSGGTRSLGISTFGDRTVDKALCWCLKPAWGNVLSMPSHKEQLARFANLAAETDMRVFGSDDVKQCFDFANRDIVMTLHGLHIQNEDLLEVIELFVRRHDAEEELSLLQGSSCSSAAMDLQLHYTFDMPMMRWLKRRSTRGLRYVDDLAFLGPSVSEAEQALARAAETLEAVGFQLKGEDGPPVDLRDPSGNKKFLGFIPRWGNDRLLFLLPESAFSSLSKGLRLCQLNKHPAKNAVARCEGWISEAGPALASSATAVVVDRVIRMAHDAGFLEVGRDRLLKVARAAVRRWNHILRQTRR